MKVLIVEDDLSTRKGLEESIKDFGFEPRSVGTCKEAAKVLEEFDPRILIVDIHLPDGDGIEILRAAREKDPDREGVVITGQGSIDNAIEALRAGAFDYLLKPLRPAQLEVVFSRLADRRRLETEVETLRAELQETGRLGDLVGRSEPMTRIFEIIRRIARSNAPILITGASGTGKEVAARTIHRLSRRGGKPFVAFNCGAISPTLIESELFGHERGSFTETDKRRVGYFEEEAAGGFSWTNHGDGGGASVKLLRVLEDRTLRRVGPRGEIKVDVRLISPRMRPAGGHKGKEAPGRPLLSPERLPDRASRSDGPARRHSPARRTLSKADRRSGKSGRHRLGPGGDRAAQFLRLAGQCARAS